MTKYSRLIVLAEDSRQQGFVRRYIYRLGYERHQIQFTPLPNNRGCGEKWVRDQYAELVQACRSRSSRANTALAVVIDADTDGIERRVRQLSVALEQAEQEARRDGEAIVHLIPKRNIETWILCLNGRSVDEQQDYSRQPGIDPLITPAAATFYDWSRPNANPPEHCVHRSSWLSRKSGGSSKTCRVRFWVAAVSVQS